MLLGLLNGVLLVLQAWLVAWAIAAGVMHGAPLRRIAWALAALVPVFVARFVLARVAERVAFQAGASVRRTMRANLLSHLQRLGPAWLQGQARGDLVNSVVGGVEALEGYYARYLPTMRMTALVPLVIAIAVLPADWVSALVMLVSAPLIPFFMWMIGKGTEELNQKQWRVLAFLSARFLDTLQGLKENVIVGRLIPAGTGGTMTQIRRIATSRDEMILDERRKSTGAGVATPMLQELSGENLPAGE